MVEVDIPSAERDRPNWATVGAVGAVMLAVGLGLAFWGTDEARTAEEASESPTPADVEQRPEPTGEPSNEEPVDEEPSNAEESDRVPLEEEVPAEDPAVEEPTAEEPVVEDAATEEPATDAPAAEEPTRVATPTTGGARISRVVPGQVAYLRCDQATGRRCSRDETLEERVWAAIAQLPSCANAPTGPGWADVRLDFEGEGAPAVGWRDTFAPDVRRLDESTTMACLRPGLTQSRQNLGAQRLLVSFRFRVE